MKATVAEIAKKVGCSPSTVSRALNGTAGVEAGLRRRILVAVRAVGGDVESSSAPRRGRPRGSLGKTGDVEIILFRRRGMEPLVVSASSLSVRPIEESTTNLFFTPRFRLTMDFYRHVINGIVSVLAANGIKTIQREVNSILDETLVAELKAARLCGVILMGEPDPQIEAFVQKVGCPVVLVDILGVPETPVVAIDNVGCTSLALHHLIELGHQQIGFIGNPDNPSFRERFHTYLGGMSEAGLAFRPEWHYRGSGHMHDIATWLQPILKAQKRPTAMLCACDHYAIGAFEGARLAGLQIPLDLSIIGIDDIEAASLTSPQMTTVRVPMVQLGACAADLLLRLNSGKRTKEILQNCEIRCRTELVVRGSTGPCSVCPLSRVKKRKLTSLREGAGSRE